MGRFSAFEENRFRPLSIAAAFELASNLRPEFESIDIGILFKRIKNALNPTQSGGWLYSCV